MRLTLLHTRIRVEERLLLDELERRGINAELVHADEAVIDLTHRHEPANEPHVLLDRCLSHSKALAIVRAYESRGAICMNPSAVTHACGDKLLTTLALTDAGVPSPRTIAAFGANGAVQAAEQLGYPVVIKPCVGSWGRMVGRLNDRDALEAVLEHKLTLGGPQHGVVYLQELVRKPDRDIRAFVVGGQAIAAIMRHGDHWITNTARGGRAEGLPVSPALDDLCRRAAVAVGGTDASLLAIDLMECPDRGLLVCEVNSTMEFRNSIETTGVDIPARIVDHVVGVAEAENARAVVA
ncbi:MAG: lysine biosynthesis protein LysX [Phycisphaerales bacterium]|jgi:[lysine-biosynthesis-protein LysW]--L-2-aminoadipate ligase